jgi:hypothetical protein
MPMLTVSHQNRSKREFRLVTQKSRQLLWKLKSTARMKSTMGAERLTAAVKQQPAKHNACARQMIFELFFN